MKTFLLRSSLGLMAALTLSHCVSSTPQSRIERNPQLFSRLSAKDREFVTSGVIREGMTRDAVFLAWGSPDRVSVGRSRGKEIESWTYLSERPVRTFNMNMGIGYGASSPFWGGPYGCGSYPYWGGGPSVMYVPYTAGVVEFTSERVTRWMATPR